MATTIEEDVASYLNANVGSLTLGTNLFEGPPRYHTTPESSHIPDECVFVMETGGPAAEAFLGSTSYEDRQNGVQIRVRSAGEDYSGGRTLARAVRDALHHAAVSGYADVSVRASSPDYLGVTEKGHHEWSVSVLARHFE